MEIPNIERYSREKEPVVDFLNEKLRISFTIEQGVFDNLPKIDDSVLEKSLELREESYHAFLGEFTIKEDGSVVVHLTHVLEIPNDDENKKYYYNEDSLGVDVYLKNIKALVDNLKNNGSTEFEGVDLIGDIHTHPVKQSELESSLSPLMPSDDDILSVIEEYKEGTLSTDRPFIFAIAANINNQMKYSFYRLVKKNEGYSYQKISSSI